MSTVSGRGRINLNAAVNTNRPTQVHLRTTDCVNAQSTKTLYKKLLAAYPDRRQIYAAYNNAHFYRNQKLAEWLTDKLLVQVFMPSYSPNLNLIEHLWKFLRQKLTTPCFYRTTVSLGRA